MAHINYVICPPYKQESLKILPRQWSSASGFYNLHVFFRLISTLKYLKYLWMEIKCDYYKPSGSPLDAKLCVAMYN